jgi:hypothetical protein
LEDIKNGTLVSKTVTGDAVIGMSLNNPSDSVGIESGIGMTVNLSDVGIESAFSAIIELSNGDVLDLGLYDTKADAYQAMKDYCDGQVEAGNMTRQEAAGILRNK